MVVGRPATFTYVGPETTWAKVVFFFYYITLTTLGPLTGVLPQTFPYVFIFYCVVVGGYHWWWKFPMWLRRGVLLSLALVAILCYLDEPSAVAEVTLWNNMRLGTVDYLANGGTPLHNQGWYLGVERPQEHFPTASERLAVRSMFSAPPNPLYAPPGGGVG